MQSIKFKLKKKNNAFFKKPTGKVQQTSWTELDDLRKIVSVSETVH